MDFSRIRNRKREVEELYGPWLVHDIQLTPEIRTRQPEIEAAPISENDKTFTHNLDSSTWAHQSPTATRIRRVVQVVSDLAKKPLDQLRVLDLGAFEGGFAMEFASRGATVVAVEGRRSNLAKAEFAKEVLGLQNLELVLDNVRNVHQHTYGRFDVVLCLGVLYHLNAPDVFEFAKNLSAMCDDVLIIETEAHAYPDESFTWEGHTYWGGNRADHDSNATEQQKLNNVLMSLDNAQSFVLTRFSLINLMQDIGCSSVHECLTPPVLGYKFRVALAGLKRPGIGLLKTAPPGDQYEMEFSEISSSRPDSELHFWFKKFRESQQISREREEVPPSGLRSTMRKLRSKFQW